MKIIYVANARIPTEKAHGKQIIKTSEALANLGSTVELWLPERKQPKALVEVDPFIYYASKPNFKIRRFKNIDLLLFAAKFPDLIQVFCFWIQQLTFVFTILLQTLSSDVVYTRSQLIAVILSLRCKKVFFEAHNISKWTFFLQKLSGIIVISNGLKDDFEKAGLGNLLLAPDGFDPNEFKNITKSSAREKLDFKKTEKIVVYVGSRQKGKGVETLEEAKKYLQKDIKLMIISTAPPTTVPYYLKAADRLILPNSAKDLYSKRYTSPMKLFEYLGSGVPIIATNTEANREILNFLNAILVEPDNAKALGESINNSFKMNLDKISDQALKDSLEYTWQQRAKKILIFLEKR